MDDTTIRRLVGNGKKGKKMPREMSGSALFGADPATYAPVGGALTGGAETGGAMTGGAMTSGSLPIYGSAMTGGAETGGALTGGKFQAKDLLPLLPLVFGLGKGEMEGALERIYGGAMTGGELAGM